MVTGYEDGRTAVWDTFTGNCSHSASSHVDRVYAVVFSPDGRRYASANPDQTVRLWETDTGQEVAVLRGPGDEVWAASSSPDGRTLVTKAFGKIELRLWRARTFDEIAASEQIRQTEQPE